MKDFYGTAVLFFYFLKWPILIGLPLLYHQGMRENIILELLWLVCFILVLKDVYALIKKHRH
jgi:hypothetical protein